MYAKTTTAIFLALIFGMFAANLLTPDRDVSENENRGLAQMPRLSLSSVSGGHFARQFESYVTDQFAGRDAWVGAKNLADTAAGRRESVKGVYFASGSFLPESFSSVDMDMFRRNLDYAGDFARGIAADYGVKTGAMLVPTAGGVLRDKLPAFAPEINQAELMEEAQKALPGFMNIMPALELNRDKYIYFRTDHHWTAQGAFYAYNEWLKAAGLPQRRESDYRRELFSGDFFGTTWSKANLFTIPPDTITAWRAGDEAVSVAYNNGGYITDSVYEMRYLAGKDKYAAFLNANQADVHIVTGKHTGRTLLVVKDSYANIFIPLALREYDEIFAVDLRYFRGSVRELAAEKKITDALLLYGLKSFAADQNLVYLNND